MIITFNRDTRVTRVMPYIDMSEWKEVFVMIDTVRKNFGGFAKEEILKANLSRKTHSMVGNPPAVRFKETVSDEDIINCPIEVNYVTNSSAIFGPNRNILRGASTRRKPKRVREEYMKITRDFIAYISFLSWQRMSCLSTVFLSW